MQAREVRKKTGNAQQPARARFGVLIFAHSAEPPLPPPLQGTHRATQCSPQLGSGEAVTLALALEAVPIPVVLMEVEPGLRPEPGRRPPHPLPLTATMIAAADRHTGREQARNPKKAEKQMTCPMNHFDCPMTAFENGA